MKKISILLVDDHRLLRDAWKDMLNDDPRFCVIAEAGSGLEAIKIAKTRKPRIVLMDINMNPMNGFDATTRIRKIAPSSEIIGVSMNNTPAYAKKLLSLGALGYVTKNSSFLEIVTAILEVNKGNTYICDEVKNILTHEEMVNEKGQPGLYNLSRREMSIAQLIKEGLFSKEIAVRLEISIKTVEVHRYNILKKLGLRNTASLVNLINSQGL